MRQPLTRLLGALLLAPATLLAAEGQIVRATELRAEPFTDAASVMPLPANTPLKSLKRKGGWYQIEVDGKQGWVRMNTLRLGKGEQKGDSGIGSTLRFLGSGRSESSGVTAATGLRGLDEEDLTGSEPDHEALKKFKQQTDADRNKKFARDGGLKQKKVPYMKPKEPEKPKSSGGGWDDEGGF